MRRRLLLAILVAATACNDASSPTTGPTAPDAAGDVPSAYPACAEFASQPPIAVPVHLEGDLAGADLVSPQQCGVVDAPYGIESAGVDRVVPLTNLRPGVAYVVKLRSSADLAFYVVTGCATESGPGADQCLLFEDASSGEVEVGRFVAGGTSAFVVVDHYESRAPSSTAFVLDVYAEQCEDDSQCTDGGAPACSDGLCVECVSSFDCPDPDKPRCDLMALACAPGVDSCIADDSAEPRDDGPSGARVLALDAAGRATLTGSTCASPHGEADYVAFDVTTLGETWDFTMTWPGGRDLDLELYDAHGTPIGLSYWEQPERARMTYLARGRYYLRIDEFASTTDASPVSYSLTAQRTLGAGCAASADCAGEYRNQIYRGHCDAGACVAIQGQGAVAEGGACDSQSDCALALHCPSFFFVANADTRDTCARACDESTDCAPLGDHFVCTSYLGNNFCVQKCTSDDHCPTAIGSQPGTNQPWRRLTCDIASGRCLP